MDVERIFPDILIDWLQNAGLAELAAVMLEAAGPLTVLGAQAIFMLEPLVRSSGSALGALAHSLEDSEQVENLVQRLRGHGGYT